MFQLSHISVFLMFPCFAASLYSAVIDIRDLSHEILKVLDLRFAGQVDDWHVRKVSDHYSWLSADEYILVLDSRSSKSALVRITDQGLSELIGFSSCVPSLIQSRIGEICPWPKWENNAKACFKAVVSSLVDPRSRILDSEFFSQPDEYLLDWISDEPGKSGLARLRSYMVDYSMIDQSNKRYFEVHVVTPDGSVVRIRVIAPEDEEDSLKVEKETVEFKGSYDSQVVY